jgi:hypothetical protein
MEDPALMNQDLAHDDDDDDAPLGTADAVNAAPGGGGAVATPDSRPSPPPPETDQEAAERAAAMAEVHVMEGANHHAASRRGAGARNPVSDQAIMGAVGGDNAVDAHQVLDESGELVRQAFVEFLQNL